jgi:hypothetical protein
MDKRRFLFMLCFGLIYSIKGMQELSLIPALQNILTALAPLKFNSYPFYMGLKLYKISDIYQPLMSPEIVTAACTLYKLNLFV